MYDGGILMIFRFSLVAWLALSTISVAMSADIKTAEFCPLPEAGQVSSPVSRFGCYSGYSEPLYDEFQRESRYLATRDGTRLAVDIYRPVENGMPVTKPLPVIFSYARYWRATENPDGSISTALGVLPKGADSGPIVSANARSNVPNLVRHGYVYVRATSRGAGASYGTRESDMTGLEANDGHDIVEWIARQPWSDGKIGMRGSSYPGMAQHLTASAAPPHLVAIFPGVAPFDEYDSSWAGTGILRKYGLSWLAREAQRDGVQEGVSGSTVNPVRPKTKMVARVDADVDGSMREAARRERRVGSGTDPLRYFTLQSPESAQMLELLQEATGGISITEMIELLYSTQALGDLLDEKPGLADKLRSFHFYRDASPMLAAAQPVGPNTLSNLVPAINRSRIATYNWGGWFDFAAQDTILWHVNNRNQKKLTMGPWTHGPNEKDNPREASHRPLINVEELRWFDYWLKGIENGVMDEAPVHFAIMDEPQKWTWESAPDWPVDDAAPISFYLDAEGNGLSTTKPASGGKAGYQVDYHVSMGESTRYHDSIGMGPMDYGELDKHAEQSLVFATAPFERDYVVVGHPEVELFVTSSAGDIELNVYMQELDARGEPFYLTDGIIRSSHRKLGQPPYDKMGLPWLDSSRAAVESTPPLDNDKPSALKFTMYPTAARFQKGHRLRIVIAGADAHSNLTIPYNPPPVISVWTGSGNASRIILPVRQTAIDR